MENKDKNEQSKMHIQQKISPVIQQNPRDDMITPMGPNNEEEDKIEKFRNLPDDYKSKLLTLKSNIKNTTKNLGNTLKEKYKNFILVINTYLQDISKNIDRVLEKKNNTKENINDIINTSIEKVNHIIELQNDIIESIKQNYKLLIDLLSIDTNYIKNYKCPNQVYVTKNCESFIKSWSLYNYLRTKKNMNLKEDDANPFMAVIFSNIYKFLEKEHISDKFKALANNFSIDLLNSDENESTCLVLNNTNCNDETIKKSKENIENIKNLKLINLESNDYSKIFKKKEINETPNENSFIFTALDTIYIKDSKLEDISFYDYFPNVEKIIIKNSKIVLNNILSNSNKLNNLKELYFNDLNLTTRGFDNIIACLNENKEIIENLQILSAKKNKITKVVLFNEEEEITEVFTNLQEINLEDNKIYKYDSSNFNVTPGIKLINLIKNNLSFNENYNSIKDNLKLIEKQKEQSASEEGKEYKRKKNLVLIAKNLFVLKGNERSEYFKYLNGVLEEFDYPMKELTLETLFNLFNKKLLFDIKFSPVLKQSLQYINVSMCSLDNNDLIKFLLLCKDLFHLKKLNVGFNLLTEEFFELYNKENIFKYLKFIEVFDFTSNEYMEVKNNYENLFKFMNNHSHLKKIEMSRTNFESLIGQFLKYKFRETKNKDSISSSSNMRANYQEMDSFIKIYEQFNKSSCKFSFRELIPKANYDKILTIASKELRPFIFKFKSS